MAGTAKATNKAATTAKESSPVAAGGATSEAAQNQPTSDAAPQEADVEDELPDPPMTIRVLEDGYATIPDQGGRIFFAKDREFQEWDYDWVVAARQGVKLVGFYSPDDEPIDLNDFVNNPDQE